MTKGLPRSLKQASLKRTFGRPLNGAKNVTNSLGATKREVITLENIALALNDQAGVAAYTNLEFFTFDAGYINFSSASSNLSFFADAAGVNTDFEGDIALGIAGVTSGTGTAFSSDELIIVREHDLTAVNSLVVSEVRASSVIESNIVHNSNGGPLSIFLNILIDDGDHGDFIAIPTNLIVNGTIILTYTPFSLGT